MRRPTRASQAGSAYLDLQNRARRERRGTQELLTLYIVERWLARLSASPHTKKFVVKGGMLLAAYDARRPTAHLDALARSMADDQATVVSLVSEVADLPLDDGVEFRTATASSRIIREQAFYSGVRVAMDAAISTATVKFRKDVNFGDPITPAPGWVMVPPLRPDMVPPEEPGTSRPGCCGPAPSPHCTAATSGILRTPDRSASVACRHDPGRDQAQ